MNDSERKNFLYQLDQRVEKGLVRRQKHQTLPLLIYSYTPMCQFTGAWDKYTLMSRGLITDTEGHVVARPFGKFFNYGEKHCPDLPRLPFQIFEKIDGSLGIYFNYDGQWHVATRGSFDNQFTDFGSLYLQLVQRFPKHWTICTEISMPAEIDGLERCVKHAPGVYLLGAIDIYSGKDVSWKGLLEHGWEGYLPRVYDSSFGDVDRLQELAKELTDTEGFIVRWANGQRVKVKTAWYFRLFRNIVRMDEKVRGMMLQEMPLPAILQELPEELHEQAKLVYKQLRYHSKTREHALMGECLRLWDDEREQFVRNSSGHPDQGLLLMLYDDKDIGNTLIETAELAKTAPVGDEANNYV